MAGDPPPGMIWNDALGWLSPDHCDKALAWDKLAEKNAEIARLKDALRRIDAVACGHKRGAAGAMQKIARDALSH